MGASIGESWEHFSG
jgi:hypothetical protein